MFYCAMKLNLLFILLTSGLIQSLAAQTDEGDWMLGGTLNFSINHDSQSEPTTTNKNLYKYLSYSISPQVGKFVKKDLLVGMNVSYQGYNWTNHLQNTNELIFRQKSQTIGIGAITRKYFSITDKVYFFAQGNINYFHRNFYEISNQIIGERKYNTNGLGIRGYGGISYFPKKWFAIEALISPISYSYEVSREDQPNVESSDSRHNFQFGINTTSIFLGINFFINKR